MRSAAARGCTPAGFATCKATEVDQSPCSRWLRRLEHDPGGRLVEAGLGERGAHGGEELVADHESLEFGGAGRSVGTRIVLRAPRDGPAVLRCPGGRAPGPRARPSARARAAAIVGTAGQGEESAVAASGEQGLPLRAVGSLPDDVGSVDLEAGSAPPASSRGVASALTGRRGLDLAYAAIDRVVERHALTRAVFVVDVEGLGRQLVVDRGSPLSDDDALLLEQLDGSGGQVTPEPAPDDVDLETVAALVALALRNAVLDDDARDGAGQGVTLDDAPGAPAADGLELAIRRLDGVRAVALDVGAGVVQVLSDGRAPVDLAHRVSTLAGRLGPGTTVEIVRTLPPPPAPEAVPAAAGWTGEPGSGRTPDGADTVLDDTGHFVLVVVADAVETHELEVHVRLDGVRTIGRAPAARGLAGAVEGTLAAVRELRPGPPLDLDWVRTVETTADRHFLVAVSLHDARSGAPHYGMADGTTPIEAAARATLVAIDG